MDATIRVVLRMVLLGAGFVRNLPSAYPAGIGELLLRAGCMVVVPYRYPVRRSGVSAPIRVVTERGRSHRRRADRR